MENLSSLLPMTEQSSVGPEISVSQNLQQDLSRNPSAQSATHAVVFARLIVDGKDHGPHAFALQVR